MGFPWGLYKTQSYQWVVRGVPASWVRATVPSEQKTEDKWRPQRSPGGEGHRTGLHSPTAPRPDILCMTVWDYIGPNGTT